MVARFAPPQLPPALSPPAAAVDLELAAEQPAALTVEDSQNYLAWEKLIVAFYLGSSIEIAILFAQIGPAPLPITFNLLSLAILMAFTCFCVGKCYSNYSKFHRVAWMLEQVGGFSMVTAFFIAIAIPFPLWLQCCTGAVYAISFLSIMICNLF
ncbi:hypothetical protein COLO4_28831 [Corchorus olitorius]|uniref:Uncharacterized protein n=1 Tax=Corchorus olitorius TaxID=93759 RepID=A0A1R3HI52_9ROSI|nr:hypothetical protein COLO4_28831 [Corchorus olitorius]